ncbi:hypothetical protein M8J77_007111 [Diaphorina citri]|nr:hypothetical protein M8J77_007111 [Diaphorina citri]
MLTSSAVSMQHNDYAEGCQTPKIWSIQPPISVWTLGPPPLNKILDTPLRKTAFDARGKDIHRASHHSHMFGPRATYRTVRGPAALIIDNVRRHDEGLYRCRADFVNSESRTFSYNLSVIVSLKFTCSTSKESAYSGLFQRNASKKKNRKKKKKKEEEKKKRRMKEEEEEEKKKKKMMKEEANKQTRKNKKKTTKKKEWKK